MSAETHAMRELIDALEQQERVESWLSLPGTKDAALGLEVRTTIGHLCDGYAETMREIEATINEPEFMATVLDRIRGRLVAEVMIARKRLKEAREL